MLKARMFFACVVVSAGFAAMPAQGLASDPGRSMVDAVNSARHSHGLRPLRVSGSLTNSASAYAGFLFRNQYFGHAERIRASRRFHMLGEVLELHPDRSPHVGRTLSEWLHSPGHRAVLLNPRLRYIGVALGTGPFRGRPTSIWVGQLGA